MNEERTLNGQLKEYELLREELMAHDKAVLQALGIMLGFVGVVTAQGITSANPYVFLVPLPVLFVLSTYISDKRWVIWLIASYLTEFIEKRGLGPQWESRLFWFRKACKKSGGFTPGQNVILVDATLFILLGVMETALFVAFAVPKKVPAWHYAIPAVLL